MSRGRVFGAAYRILTPLGYRLMNPPEKILARLTRSRLFEGVDDHPLGIDTAEHMAHGTILSRGVHPL